MLTMITNTKMTERMTEDNMLELENGGGGSHSLLTAHRY
jgi:hypothetical protein